MVVFHPIYRKFTVVDDPLLSKVVPHENLLQFQIPSVLFVFKYQTDSTGMPGVATASAYAFLIENVADLLQPIPITVKVEDFLYNYGFVRHHGDFTIYEPIPKHGAGGSPSFLKSLSDAPFAVVADRKALGLGKRSKKRQHDFAVGVQSLDVLFFKENIDSEFLQLTNRPQKRDRISGKAADRFCYDHIDVSGSAV